MGTEPKDIAFSNASKNRDHNIFTEEFYGGADTFIYIDDERYENISALSFEIRETVKPIYSYASRIFDDLAVGTRIVQGVIKVPVKNEGPVDRITTDENNGYNELTNVGSINVPDWVYKYKPKSEDKANNNVKYINDNTNRARIANVQTALIKTKAAPANLVINGVVDFNTKLAIANYKKDQQLTVNTKCDLELENRLLSSEDNIGYAKSGCSLRYEPSDSSISLYTVPTRSRLVVQDYADDEWLLVQIDKGMKGYIKKGEIMI